MVGSNQELQEMTNKLVERAGAYAMEISTEKSKVMVNSIKDTTSNIIMRGHKLEELEGYLGASVAFVNENYDEISSSTNFYHVTKTRRDAT